VESDAGRIEACAVDAAHPAYFGRLCTKGATLHLTTTAGTCPVSGLRRKRSARRMRAVWERRWISRREIRARISKRPDSVAFYVSGQRPHRYGRIGRWRSAAAAVFGPGAESTDDQPESRALAARAHTSMQAEQGYGCALEQVGSGDEKYNTA